jgi:hypothetical protein
MFENRILLGNSLDILKLVLWAGYHKPDPLPGNVQHRKVHPDRARRFDFVVLRIGKVDALNIGIEPV